MKKFEVGERVQFIYGNKLLTGRINNFSQVYGERYVNIEVDEDAVTIKIQSDNIAKLDQPKPVVVPEMVANFIKSYDHISDRYRALTKVLSDVFTEADEVDEWTNENMPQFIRAVIDGYVVEEEPKYYVKLPAPFLFLSQNKWCPYTHDVREASKYTKREIERIDKRYWAFAVPVEEVEAE